MRHPDSRCRRQRECVAPRSGEDVAQMGRDGDGGGTACAVGAYMPTARVRAETWPNTACGGVQGQSCVRAWTRSCRVGASSVTRHVVEAPAKQQRRVARDGERQQRKSRRRDATEQRRCKRHRGSGAAQRATESTRVKSVPEWVRGKMVARGQQRLAKRATHRRHQPRRATVKGSPSETPTPEGDCEGVT